ncbi:MAG: sulfatase [Candidatus Binatia bacterium]
MLVLAAAGLAATGCDRLSPPPSVLLVVVDTLRADAVGVLGGGPGRGSPGALTPNIDAWAGQAAVFRRASTPAPFTMPAMAALFTGAYPDRSGVIAHEPGVGLVAWPGLTLAEAARQAGAATAAVVANPWLVRSRTGFDRGFDTFTRLHGTRTTTSVNSATAVTDEAIRLIEAAGDRRFFVWAHYFDPHMPYEPPAAFAEAAGAPPGTSRVMSDFASAERNLRGLYRGDGYGAGELDHARRLYDGEVRYTDREVGRLLARLEALGLADRTLVVVASDHGESLGEHGLFFAHDYTLYEELTRVALLIRGPGIEAGVRDDEVSLIDVAPTICRLAAWPCRGDIDGRDLLAGPRGGRTLFAAATPLRAKGTPFDGLEVSGAEGRWTMALRDGKKLVRIPRQAGPLLEFYDLGSDPAETRNLAAQAPPEAAGLRTDLEQWSARMETARPAATSSPTVPGQQRDEETLRSLGYLQ